MTEGKTILLVEDEGIIALNYQKKLQKQGYTVFWAPGPEECLDLVEKETIHLILMDIFLGKGRKSGPELAKEIQKTKEIPLVFHTSHGEEEVVDRVKGITYYGYVLKNSGDFVLFQTIEMALELEKLTLQKVRAEKLANAARLQRFESSLQAASMAWWEMHLPSGKVVFDDNKVKMLGRKPEDFNTYHDFVALVHPEDQDRANQAMMDHLEGRKDSYRVDYRIQCQDGSYKWYRDVGKIDPREGDGVVLLGVAMDITLWKKNH